MAQDIIMRDNNAFMHEWSASSIMRQLIGLEQLSSNNCWTDERVQIYEEYGDSWKGIL